MKPLGDGFVALIRMMIAPVIFCTVVHGIGGMRDLKRAGRVALKALVYFEAITSLALLFGLLAVNLWRPGADMHIDPRRARCAAGTRLGDPGAAPERGRNTSWTSFPRHS